MIESISKHCVDISIEICSINQWVSVENIIHVLLQRYNVVTFEQLGIGPSVLSVPSLMLIWDLNRKVITVYYTILWFM